MSVLVWCVAGTFVSWVVRCRRYDRDASFGELAFQAAIVTALGLALSCFFNLGMGASDEEARPPEVRHSALERRR